MASATSCKKTLPNRTPVRLALPLAPKLHSAPTHPPTAFGAYPIQNARNHVCGRFNSAHPNERHIHLPSTKLIALRSRVATRGSAFLVPRIEELAVELFWVKMKPSLRERHQDKKGNSLGASVAFAVPPLSITLVPLRRR